jgi:hypothetical protein
VPGLTTPTNKTTMLTHKSAEQIDGHLNATVIKLWKQYRQAYPAISNLHPPVQYSPVDLNSFTKRTLRHALAWMPLTPPTTPTTPEQLPTNSAEKLLRFISLDLTPFVYTALQKAQHKIPNKELKLRLRDPLLENVGNPFDIQLIQIFRKLHIKAL